QRPEGSLELFERQVARAREQRPPGCSLLENRPLGAESFGRIGTQDLAGAIDFAAGALEIEDAGLVQRKLKMCRRGRLPQGQRIGSCRSEGWGARHDPVDLRDGAAD